MFPTGTSRDRRYGHFVRSDRAHADIVSIDAAAALAQPGVLAVFTGEDIRAALKSLPCALPVKGRGGMELINPGRPALAQGRVRFTGDAGGAGRRRERRRRAGRGRARGRSSTATCRRW